jgi:CBS domain-containing protein
MTQSPECATVDTPILEALHTMHDGKFLHLPVLDTGTWMNKQCCLI